MARKLRVEFAGECDHVLNRRSYRGDLFATAGAARSFQDCRFEAGERFLWRRHAFTIMRNHRSLFDVPLEQEGSRA